MTSLNGNTQNGFPRSRAVLNVGFLILGIFVVLWMRDQSETSGGADAPPAATEVLQETSTRVEGTATEIPVEKEAPFLLKVIDAITGESLPEALVLATVSSSGPESSASPIAESGTTPDGAGSGDEFVGVWSEADGGFHFDGVPDQTLFDLSIDLPGYTLAYLSTGLPYGAVETISLHKLATVYGKVIGSTGAPISDAEVVITLPTPVWNKMVRFHADNYGTRVPRQISLLTDGVGGFFIEELWPGHGFRFEVSASHFAPTKLREVTVESGDQDLVIEMQAAGGLHGKVVSPGSPSQAGFQIKIHCDMEVATGPTRRSFNGKEAEMVTGDSGDFLFDSLQPNTKRLEAQRFDEARQVYEYAEMLLPDLKRRENRDCGVILVETSNRLRCRVVDPDGNPIPGDPAASRRDSPLISVAPFGGIKYASISQLTPSADGEVVIWGLPAGRAQINCSIYRPIDGVEYKSLQLHTVLEEGRETVVVLQMEPRTRSEDKPQVQFRITNPEILKSATPLTGFKTADEDHITWMLFEEGSGCIGNWGELDGEFPISTPIGSGELERWVTVRKHDLWGQSRRFRSDTQQTVEVTLGKAAHLRGRLSDRHGGGIEGCQIYVGLPNSAMREQASWGGSITSVITDSSGRFELVGVPPSGEVVLVARVGNTVWKICDLRDLGARTHELGEYLMRED